MGFAKQVSTPSNPLAVLPRPLVPSSPAPAPSMTMTGKLTLSRSGRRSTSISRDRVTTSSSSRAAATRTRAAGTRTAADRAVSEVDRTSTASRATLRAGVCTRDRVEGTLGFRVAASSTRATTARLASREEVRSRTSLRSSVGPLCNQQANACALSHSRRFRQPVPQPGPGRPARIEPLGRGLGHVLLCECVPSILRVGLPSRKILADVASSPLRTVSFLQNQNDDPNNLDEQGLQQAHQQAYGQGDSSNMGADSLGAAAALNALKKFTSGQGGQQSGGGGNFQSQLIGQGASRLSSALTLRLTRDAQP